MRIVCRLLALASCFALVGFSQPSSLTAAQRRAFERSSPTAAQFEAFKRFAERPAARTAWSNEIGRVDTDRARLVITAMIVEDTAESAQQMRGIRMDLTEGDRKDRLYISEDHLDRFIHGMQDIAKSSHGFCPGRSDAPNRCHGSGVFWMPQGQGFTASECVFGDWCGLVVHQGDFRFTSTHAGDFAELFVAARDELNTYVRRPAAPDETP